MLCVERSVFLDVLEVPPNNAEYVLKAMEGERERESDIIYA